MEEYDLSSTYFSCFKRSYCVAEHNGLNKKIKPEAVGG